MWRTLTEDDILGVLNATEASVYQTVVIGDGQDALADAITAVVNQCRGYIADHPGNELAEGLTLPERVHLSALHIIRVELLTRLDLEVSEDRRRAKSDAIRFFERVADGRVSIEAPDGATEPGGSTPVAETLSSRDRISTRQKLSGL
jgi:hypothetical protein